MTLLFTLAELKKLLELKVQLGAYSLSVLDGLVMVSVLIVTQLLLWVLIRLVNRWMKKREVELGKRFTIKRLIRTLVYIIGAVVALQTIGIDLSILLTGSAALLVGVGIGLQGFFNDVVSGFVMLFEGGLRVGDTMQVEGDVARVERIDLRSTRVVNRRGELLVLPNGQVLGQTVKNLSQGQEHTRVDITVTVQYGSDVRRVQALLVQAATGVEGVAQDQEIRVLLREFGDNGLRFELRFWTADAWLREVTASEVRYAVEKALRESGVVIPYPQHVLHWASPPTSEG
jgi:small-conductance mechanosensitive channel